MSGSTERNVVRTLALHEPILVAGEPVKTLEFRKPRAHDMKATDAVSGDNERTIMLISRLTAIPEPSIDTLSIEDYGAAAGVIADFFEKASL